MRCAKLLVVADTSDPILARLHELHRVRAKTEKAFKKAQAEERAEAMRLMALGRGGPGVVAIAETMAVTREAVRQAFIRWRKGHDTPSPDA